MAANDTAKKDGPPQRTPAQIEADLVAARERITASTEHLIDRVHPQRVKQRTLDNAKAFVAEEVENAKSLVFNARGDLRKERLVAVGAGLAGAITFLTLIGRLARRGRGG